MEKVNFGKAIEAIKKGKSIKREGWNGKNMQIYLNLGIVAIDTLGLERGSELYEKKKGMFIEGVDAELFFVGGEGVRTRLPNLNMVTPLQSTVTGWLASQTDILAEDWIIIDNTNVEGIKG